MVSDNKVKELCGSDAALYLAFLRMSSKFFLTISAINCGVLYLYLTGKNNSDKIGAKDSYAMKALTILNITGVTWKVFIVYLVALGAVVAMKIMLISVYSNMFHMDERLSAQSDQQVQDVLEMAKDISLMNAEDQLQAEWKKLQDGATEEDIDFREKELTDVNVEKHVVCIRGIAQE